MAKPLDLEALGIPGNRNPTRVKETMGAIVPFTHGSADLEIDHGGSVASADKPPTQERTDGSDDVADKHFRSRIGRRFRSF